MAQHPLRFLVNPQDIETYVKVTETLMDACCRFPDSWDAVVGKPGIEPHVGYHDSTLSSVVWAAEYGTTYMRLTIRPGRHEVFDALLSAVVGNL